MEVPNAASIRIAVLSPSSIVRLGLCQVLCQDPDFEVVAQADLTIGTSDTFAPEVVFLDADLFRSVDPGVWLQLKQDRYTYLIVLLRSEDPQAISEALSHGADALLHPAADASTIVLTAKLATQSGSFIVSPQLLKPFTRALVAINPDGSNIGLTRREREVLSLLDREYTDAMIARTLFLSVRTVKQHVGHILQKLGVQNRHQAVDVSRSMHLLPDRPKEVEEKNL